MSHRCNNTKAQFRNARTYSGYTETRKPRRTHQGAEKLVIPVALADLSWYIGRVSLLDVDTLMEAHADMNAYIKTEWRPRGTEPVYSTLTEMDVLLTNAMRILDETKTIRLADVPQSENARMAIRCLRTLTNPNPYCPSQHGIYARGLIDHIYDRAEALGIKTEGL